MDKKHILNFLGLLLSLLFEEEHLSLFASVDQKDTFLVIMMCP